ncbi:glycoside-pentoside-hexuronide (GPH):cation symporter [Isoptericola sp. b441]|uniref:Glycoside-pentoside-hexuronide (GPH):cation symporter n=1 Tax=Actinotalea lenta TaxID=3064654 RepID=A0ABT9DF22_9CELL|nr:MULTISPECIES: glycoside-pentoside-hexuronide (GPH):cation symporter [unclassified Isoptericola]MDO8108012.1 glycoside-pentoside-hexuronide (GPH):cation symporter [Isoptericola sp. b441]MDO8120318.1 glycoside-pentoside-hexuronide (GPH):cation symporter [Isoptericola sp. b490]
MAVMTVPSAPATASTAVPRLTLRNYLAYAAGDAANNLSFTMAGMFLILYYTNVVGLEGAVIGTMFLAVRFIDAITDVVTGRIVDAKRPGRLGKFRPFVLWFSFPLLVASMAIYSAKVFFPGIAGTAAVVYMYATYILMGSVFYTLVNIPYGSMAPTVTQVPTERGKLAAFRGYGAAIAVLALAFIISPQIRANTGNPAGLQQSLFVTTAAFVVVGMGLYLFFVFNLKERVARPENPVTLRDSVRTLTKNKPLGWLSLGAVLFLTGLTALSTLGSYVAIYVQRDAQFIAWNILAQTLALFVVGPLVPTIVRTIGKRTGYVGLGAVMVVGAAVLAFAPLSTTPLYGPVAFFLIGIGVQGVNTLMWALEADTVEYGEWKTGQRTEGTTYAVFSFTRKMGQAIGGLVGGLALTWAGFSAASASQGEAQADGVAQNIQHLAGLLVGGFALASIAVMLLYPLTEAKFSEITAEIAERRGTKAS